MLGVRPLPSSAEMPSSTQAVCEEALSYANNRLMQVAMILETILSVLALWIAFVFYWRSDYRKVAAHRNLKVRFMCDGVRGKLRKNNFGRKFD